MGSLINADVALVSIIPDKTLALTLDRIIYLLFVFRLPIYIQFVHTFLISRGEDGLNVLPICSADLSLVYFFRSFYQRFP